MVKCAVFALRALKSHFNAFFHSYGSDSLLADATGRYTSSPSTANTAAI